MKKEPDLSDLLPKKDLQSFDEIEEMANVFLNLAKFVKLTFLTLAPPSGYALSLKASIKVSKVS